MPMFIHREFTLSEQEDEETTVHTFQEQDDNFLDGLHDLYREEDDEFCDVCQEPRALCVCRPCSICGAVGNPSCYEIHGMKYTKQQILTSTRAHIAELEDELQDLHEYVEEIELLPDDWETEKEHVLF